MRPVLQCSRRILSTMKIIGPAAASTGAMVQSCLRKLGNVFCVALLVIAMQPVALARDCSMTSVGSIPINDLGSGMYLTYQGGLYPGGVNVRPASHESAGLSLARSIGPMDSSGNPDANGSYVLLSIGMSNASQEFDVFVSNANADRDKNENLVVVNGAQGGATAMEWANASSRVWTEALQRLSQSGVNANQVAVVWAKLANSASNETVEQYRTNLQQDVDAVMGVLREKFPNLKMVYLSSRIYAGYATSPLNPEPYAYESGFVMKTTIEKQLNGELSATPWLSWGPYLWADGLSPRSDGLTWECTELREDDGTHPSEAGMQKVADILLDFFKSDSTAVEWYLGGSRGARDTIAPAPPEDLVVSP